MKIKNFVIISHIDHGKSTLADRFLELTKSVGKGDLSPQFLDSMDLEKERGITIKMHPCRMKYKGYTLNLIDTPGHVDFSYEISRALACVEGGILLVDATKGIQAQTLFNLQQARGQGLYIIGVINKIDLPHARVEETREELSQILDQPKSHILEISARTGENVELLLDSIVENFPSPRRVNSNSLRSLIFDSNYNPYSGVIAYLRVFQGSIKEGENIFLKIGGKSTQVREVGIFTPHFYPKKELREGEIGYAISGLKNPSSVKVGDTIGREGEEVEALPGYCEPDTSVYLSIYPENSDDYGRLKFALEKLKLKDPSLEFIPEVKTGLGRGFKIGFLGSLHGEITITTIERDYGIKTISTIPQVPFKVVTTKGKELEISSPENWPDATYISKTKEPWAEIELVFPNDYWDKITKITSEYEIYVTNTVSMTAQRSFLSGMGPLRKIVGENFYEDLKSSTEGFASFGFRKSEFREANLAKLEVLVAGERKEAFSRIVAEDEAEKKGRKLVEKLKEAIPAQQFALPIQASVRGKVVARETKKAIRKDVTGDLYGGDVTRKKKLLEVQRKGKKKLKNQGKVNIPSETYIKMLRS